MSTSKSPEDTVKRAATILYELQAGKLMLSETCPAMPLRWGTLAMDGLKPFERLLHVTSATLCLRKCGSLIASDMHAARSQAGQAWRHLLKADSWCHDSALSPPIAALRDVAALAIDTLSIEAVIAQDSASPRAVALLQLVENSPAASKGTKSAARKTLARVVAKGWALTHADARPGAKALGLQTGDLLKYAATMCGHVIKHCDPDAIDDIIARFVAIHTQVYGVSPEATSHATQTDPLSPLESVERLAARYSPTRTMKELSASITMPTVASEMLGGGN